MIGIRGATWNKDATLGVSTRQLWQRLVLRNVARSASTFSCEVDSGLESMSLYVDFMRQLCSLTLFCVVICSGSRGPAFGGGDRGRLFPSYSEASAAWAFLFLWIAKCRRLS
jgi:hypothetical protein